MPKRRMNGEGTFYQRSNGLWVYELTLGFDEKGKRIKKTISSMNLDKLKSKINDVKYLKDRNMLTVSNNYTLGDWLDLWLETYKKNTVKPSTYDIYYGAIKRHIKPAIGHLKLDKVNNITIQQLINNLSEKSPYMDKGMSLSSLKKIELTLSQAFDQAINLKLIYQNPCKDIKMPNKVPRKSLAFTPEEQVQFLKICIGNNSKENLFNFDFHTGLRLGELLALTWDDVDFKNKVINVNKTLVVVNDYENENSKYKTIINSTKTDSSEREIPLTAKAVEILKNQKNKNDTNSPFVFYSKTGTPLLKRNVYRTLKSILAKAEINSPLTVHSIRHSFATRLLEKGADIKTISELLGHKSIKITLDIYSHVSQNLKKETISLLEN